MSTDPAKLEQLFKATKIILSPCKNLPGNMSSSYDDRMIMQIAAQFDAAVISNDNFRDLLNENPSKINRNDPYKHIYFVTFIIFYLEWDEIINSRVVGYTWIQDIVFFPDDPYGRRGDSFQRILHKLKDPEPQSNQNVMVQETSPNDSVK